MTKKELVKRHLLAGNTITPMEALTEYGALRLSSIIYDLRKEGYNIRTRLIDTFTGRRVAQYELVKEGEQQG